MDLANSFFLEPVWWVGLLISSVFAVLIAKLISPLIDKGFSKISDWWRIRYEKRKKAFDGAVDYLLNSPNEQLMFEIIYVKDLIMFLVFIVSDICVSFIPKFRPDYFGSPFKVLLFTLVHIFLIVGALNYFFKMLRIMKLSNACFKRKYSELRDKQAEESNGES